jgi:hypothetical protein
MEKGRSGPNVPHNTEKDTDELGGNQEIPGELRKRQRRR